jgi:dTDP-glucose 4,6-dehydratase
VTPRDLDELIDVAAGDLRHFAGMRLLVTGGTGFVGRWLLASIAHANRRLATGIRASVLTRDPDAFRARAPELAEAPGISLVRGDVLALGDVGGAHDGVVLGATAASAKINDELPLVMLDTIVGGTRATLELAASWGRIPVLFTSSGAIYGKQPPEIVNVPETHLGGPDPLDTRWVYHEGKRVAELSCAIFARDRGLDTKIARMFTFVGPSLPIDAHFAMGNFIRDALHGGPIVISGDGTPLRSFMYPTDMVNWLWAIFARGMAARAYNVGAERAVSIAETAAIVAAAAGGIPVVVRGSGPAGALPDPYVPSTRRVREELGVAERVSVEEGVARTLAWHRAGAPRG